MAVPLLDLAAHHELLHTEIMAAIGQVFHSQVFILGPEVSKLEERWLLIARHGRRPQGTMCGHSEGDKVLWVATADGSEQGLKSAIARFCKIL